MRGLGKMTQEWGGVGIWLSFCGRGVGSGVGGCREKERSEGMWGGR